VIDRNEEHQLTGPEAKRASRVPANVAAERRGAERPVPAHRPPRRTSVAGVAGGVGTTTVATALGAADCGVFSRHRGRVIDVLVCLATGDSLVRAGRAAQQVAADGMPRPVVAVTRPDPQGPSRPVSARMQLLEPHAAAVVVLPFVRRWREVAEPQSELRGLLTRQPNALPRPLRRYAAALHGLRAALDAPGRLHAGPTGQPTVARPAPRATAGGGTPTCTP
jgi:hypothetical protein